MAKKLEQKPAESAPDRPICPYCKTPCKHNGKQYGRTYYICNVEAGGCGKFTTKIGKAVAPAYDNQGFSARP